LGEKGNDLLMKIEAVKSRSFTHGSDELNKQREAAAKYLYQLAFEGTLTREPVEFYRDIISPEHYNKFLQFSRGESRLPDKSDPNALILLQRMAMNGDADFQECADELLRQGKLAISDYAGRTNEALQWRKPVMKEVDGILRTGTGYSESSPNPDAADSYNMAHRDFMDWLNSDEGKKADDNATIRMAERIGDVYRFNTAQTRLAVPLPRNLAGTEMRPDIPATLRNIEDERAAGRLTDEQYKREMIRTKRLADSVQAEEDTKKQGAAKGNTR
jgi:hypothetical protein